MESALSFSNSSVKPLPHHVQVRVIGQLKVVDTCHDAGQVVVRGVRRLAGLTHDSEHGREALEAYGMDD